MTERIPGKPITRKSKEDKNSSCQFLILHNDEIHTFDFVIESLMEICGHDNLQAEQCAFMTHYKGKCDVKKGNRNQLKQMQLGLIEKGLKASID
jgi:ATP-dependent Clp protease adaptor protein ClpS